MITTEQLITFLKKYKKTALVTDQQNRGIIHIINDTEGNVRLCVNKPIGICNRTGEYVYPSEVKGYTAYCPELDEDLYDFEFTKIQTTEQDYCYSIRDFSAYLPK